MKQKEKGAGTGGGPVGTGGEPRSSRLEALCYIL